MSNYNATVADIPCIGKVVIEDDGNRTTWRGWAKPVGDILDQAGVEEHEDHGTFPVDCPGVIGTRPSTSVKT